MFTLKNKGFVTNFAKLLIVVVRFLFAIFVLYSLDVFGVLAVNYVKEISGIVTSKISLPEAIYYTIFWDIPINIIFVFTAIYHAIRLLKYKIAHFIIMICVTALLVYGFVQIWIYWNNTYVHHPYQFPFRFFVSIVVYVLSISILELWDRYWFLHANRDSS